MRKATHEKLLKHLFCDELDDDGFVADAIADRSINTSRDFLDKIDDLNEVNSVKNRSGKMIQMDPTLRHILHQWLNNNTIVHEHLDSKGITTLGQFKQLISDPNMVNLIKDKTGASISDELRERLSEVLSYMNQLQMLHGPISKVGVYDFMQKTSDDFDQWFDAAVPFVTYDEAKAKLHQRRLIQIQQHTGYFGQYHSYSLDDDLDDDDDVPGVELCKPSSPDDYTDDISTPNLASDCSNRFPTAEKSTFSTTTTDRNFAFIDARSNHDNMNSLLFSYASNTTDVPRLTIAKQTFEAQSFDRGIPSVAVASPASLMAAKHFFDEQSKLFDRGNPSTDLISTGLAEAGLVHEEARCIFNCRCGQMQCWVRKHLGGYPYLCQDLKGYPLLSTSCFHPTTIRLEAMYPDLGTSYVLIEDTYWGTATDGDICIHRWQRPHCAFNYEPACKWYSAVNFLPTAIDLRQPLRLPFGDDNDKHNDVGFATNEVLEHKTVHEVGECAYLTAVSSYVLISSANVQYLKRAGNIDGGCFIVMITDGGRLIGWNITGYISDSNNVSGRLETDDLVGKKDGELGRKEVELGDNAYY